MITFAGGLGSIILGAALIGAVIALARLLEPGGWNWIAWLGCIVAAIVSWLATYRCYRLLSTGGLGAIATAVVALPCVGVAVVVTLTIIGAAAGVR